MKDMTLEQIMEFLGSVPPGTSLPSIMSKYGRTSVYYKAGALAQLKSGQVLLSSDKPEVGITSFDGNKLPKGVNGIVYGFRVLFDTVAGVQAAIKTAAWKSEAPAVFKNGEVKIGQNGQLFFGPGTAVTNFKGVSTGNSDDFTKISPVYFREQAAIDVLFDLAGSSAVDQAYKIEFLVFELAESTIA